MTTRTTAIVLALLALLSFAWLSPQDPGNAQVVTRLALTLSILDRGKLDIDPWADRTIDKAPFEGHTFADKAPGQSLLALPAVALAKAVFTLTGADRDATDPEVFRRYAWWATLGTNGLLSALAVAVVFALALRLGASRAGAVFGAIALGFASPFFGWSTAFFAHTISASLLLFAFAAVFAPRPGERAAAPRHSFGFGLLLGLILGLIVSVDLTSAPMAAIAGLFALAFNLRHNRFVLLALLGGILLGGVVGVLPLLLYNWAVFHSPFKLGYSSVVGFDGMQQGFFGITLPNPAVALELVFGLYRGLVPLAPVLLLVPLGLVRMWRADGARPVVWAILAAVAIYLWINSSYVYWNGGWSTGPRHLIPTLPFLCLALCFAWPATVPGKIAASVLRLAGMILAAMGATVNMFAPENFRNPVVDVLLPGLLSEGGWMRALPLLPVWIGLGLMLLRADRIPAMPRRRIAAEPL